MLPGMAVGLCEAASTPQLSRRCAHQHAPRNPFCTIFDDSMILMYVTVTSCTKSLGVPARFRIQRIEFTFSSHLRLLFSFLGPVNVLSLAVCFECTILRMGGDFYHTTFLSVLCTYGSCRKGLIPVFTIIQILVHILYEDACLVCRA